MAPAVARLLRDPAIGARPVIGQSLGGLTAIQLAAQFPEVISALVIVDITPSRRLIPGTERIRDFMRGQESFADYDEVVAAAQSTGMGRDRAGLERGIILNTRRRPDGRLVFKHHFAPPPRANLAERDITYLWSALESLRIPVLLVRGTRGIVDRAQVEEFRERVPVGSVVVLEAGHNVQREAPVALARAIAAHVGVAAAG
jgi:pimeloyl-ACP methyl ester carboxylesterase